VKPESTKSQRRSFLLSRRIPSQLGNLVINANPKLYNTFKILPISNKLESTVSNIQYIRQKLPHSISHQRPLDRRRNIQDITVHIRISCQNMTDKITLICLCNTDIQRAVYLSYENPPKRDIDPRHIIQYERIILCSEYITPMRSSKG
jgi:hypothetical protein